MSDFDPRDPIIASNADPDTPAPQGERAEPYGLSLRIPCCFYPEDAAQELYVQYIGWHNWSLVLTGDLAMLHRYAVGHIDGSDPYTGETSEKTRDGQTVAFDKALLSYVPRYLCTVWELRMNRWSVPDVRSPVSRLLVDLREGRVVSGTGRHGRFAVQSVFEAAAMLAPALEKSFGLAAGMSALRHRHAEHHAREPWGLLTWEYLTCQLFEISVIWRHELGNRVGRRIVTGDVLDMERWASNAETDCFNMMAHGPGFDNLAHHSSPVDTDRLARFVARRLAGLDQRRVRQELADDMQLVQNYKLELDMLPPTDEADALDGEAQVAPTTGTLPAWVGENFKAYQYKLLKLLWPRLDEEVGTGEVVKAVYGHERHKEKQRALEQLLIRTNRKLAQIGQHFEVSYRRGWEVILLRPVQ
jgi:hypothetical protein